MYLIFMIFILRRLSACDDAYLTQFVPCLASCTFPPAPCLLAAPPGSLRQDACSCAAITQNKYSPVLFINLTKIAAEKVLIRYLNLQKLSLFKLETMSEHED